MVKAARAQRARTKGRLAGVERQVATYGAQRPDRMARDRRIRSAKRDARRALRARASAQRATRAAEATVGAAARRLLDEGLSLRDAAVLLGLSRSAARRLTRIASETTDPVAARSSTEPGDDRAAGGVSVHGHHSSAATSGATTAGNL